MKDTEDLLLYSLGKENAEIRALMNAIFGKKERSIEKSTFYGALRKMTEACECHGIDGNLWNNYLTLQLIYDENAYSLTMERRHGVVGTIVTMGHHDLKIIMKLFNARLSHYVMGMETQEEKELNDYRTCDVREREFHGDLRRKVQSLSRDLGQADSPSDFIDILTAFYGTTGVGSLGLFGAFKITGEDDAAYLEKITRPDTGSIEELVGYEAAKEKLIKNTQDFLRGRAPGNCLLYGESGTGKSTAVRSLLKMFGGEGLKIIEMYKYQYKVLPRIVSEIRNRHYSFIIFMDDLSFEEFEIEYKYLKAFIEGGLESPPANVVIYATSNRRHLIKETFRDKKDLDEELHVNETVQEKLSLVSRFGVTIYFGRPDKEGYHHMVNALAKRYQIAMEEEELRGLANQWELSHGGRSGRVARQLIDYLR